MSLRVESTTTEICLIGKNTGIPMTFVKLVNNKSRQLSLATVISNIVKMRNNNVCISGPEPLLQDDAISLVYELVEKGYKVNIQANCSLPLDDVRKMRSFFYTLNVRTPSSRLESTNFYSNLINLSEKDEVKFNISDIEDYEFMKEILKKFPTRASIIAIQVDKNTTNELANWLIEDKPENVRMSMT